MPKKQEARVISKNNEHSYVIGERYEFYSTFTKASETGTLLYCFTRRIYKTDENNNLDPNEWKVIDFRCGYTPDAEPEVSRHLGLGAFTISPA